MGNGKCYCEKCLPAVGREGRSNLFLFTYPHQREGAGEGTLTPDLHHSTFTINVASCSGLSINWASFRKEELAKSCFSLKWSSSEI